MSESLFNIFGGTLEQHVRTPARQPLSNYENMGKGMPSAPIKPNEPMRKNDSKKKTFLSNVGATYQCTPTPRGKGPRIVDTSNLTSSTKKKIPFYNFEELEFTKPTYKYDNYHTDIFDYLPLPGHRVPTPTLPPTPPPKSFMHSMEMNEDEMETAFMNSLANTSLDVDDLGLPDIF